ncbi:MAG: S8 family serine peptidase [Candidatus Paracaedibacteraceae bacterium]|nr:S8 family serine peptidase [Candidatus Paracaedibacteraceae bacterium]
MKKIALSLLMASCFVNPSAAETPWQAVCRHKLTPSIFEQPQGNFSDCKVGVVDNGFIEDHPLLKERLDKGWNGRDRNHNVAASIVGDFYHHERGKICSHGTHVAGIVAQLAPHIDIVPIKRGTSAHRSVISDKESLEYLLTRDDVKIVNLSFGIKWDRLGYSIMKLAEQGKLIVIAAGNSGKALKHPTLIRLLADPRINSRVVLVGATERIPREKLASYSNKSTSAVESAFIAVPGTNITSAVPYQSDRTGMKELSGTSMAAPIFVGAVARLMTEFDASVDEVRQVLFDTANKQSNWKYFTPHTGQGIMNFVAARNEFKKRAATNFLSPATVVSLTQPAAGLKKPQGRVNPGKAGGNIATKVVKTGAAVTETAYNFGKKTVIRVMPARSSSTHS